MANGEYKNIMKNFFKINRALVAKKKLVMIIMAVALTALPAMAQDWQSTSAMQGSGSSYSPQVTAVGATDVNDMATTTETNQSQPKGPNRAKKFDTGGESGQASEYPIGDAVLPLMVMAFVFCGVIALRRKRALES